MKNKIKMASIILATATGLLFTSCGKKGCTDPLATNFNEDATKHDGSCEYADNAKFFITDKTVEGTVYKKIEGTFDINYTLTSDVKWLLSGGVFIEEGNRLTIEAGTQIFAADDGTVPFLSVQQGAQIWAEGTSTSPIIFTSVKSNPRSGSWGGIIINGFANINTGETAEGEGSTGIYGGTNDADNSGILKYVRVEYAGKLLSADNELNSFSFNGVGSETTLEYLQAYKGADDGFEFFGGTVNLKYAISSGIEDDCFDWTHGWRGNGQFWVALQGSEGGDRGIEADNNGDNNVATPYSEPTLSNITLVGADDGDGANTGMRLREGTKAKIYNVIVTNFPANGIRVSDTESENNVVAGSLLVTNSISYNNGTNWKNCPTFEPTADTNNEDSSPSLNGYIGTSTTKAMDPTSINAWFTGATYKGAVPTSNDWTSDWTKEL